MKLWTRSAIVLVLMFVPLVASAQYRDLDTALATLERGFGDGDPQAIAAGISGGDQIKLQFPGLVGPSGFYGRDQAQEYLDSLFNKVKPSGFERLKASGGSGEGQYHITARWTINVNGKTEARELYVTMLKKDGGRWAIVSATSAGK